MSRLFAAMEKQKKTLTVAQSRDAANAIQENVDLHENAGAEAQAAILTLPPMLIEYSKEFAEEIAVLYRSLAVANQGAPGSILICSAESDSGTTTIALNLASYIGTNEGCNTLFVEADFQRPYLSGSPGGKKAGFSDLLNDQGAVVNYTSPSSTPGLEIMHTGRITEASERLVTQNRVRYILAECKKEYPFIIFDGAPINASPTTLELAKVVDGVVMVARANALAEVVERAMAALDNANANIVGLVYNDY